MNDLDEFYFGLNGEHISRDEYIRLMESRYRSRSTHPDGETSPEEDPTRIGSDHVGEAWISTVWIGINHNFGDGPPLIFETMVFGGPHEEWTFRYSSKEQAREGHELVVLALTNGEPL